MQDWHIPKNRLDGLDPRCKIVGTMLLAFSFSTVTDQRLLASLPVLTLLIFLVSGLPLTYLLKRLKIPSVIVLAMVAALPVISGQTEVLNLGVISLTREGLEIALIISIRFLCIVALAVTVIGSIPLTLGIKALRAMGLPWIMADMAFLVLRYMEVTAKDYTLMRTAIRLRGFRDRGPGLKIMRTIAWLMGCLLVRGYERSEHIYRAMRLRGYGIKNKTAQEFNARATDLAVLVATVVSAVVIFTLEIKFG